MTEPGCARKRLAEGDFVVVEQCSCGSVHLTIGAVTLRLASSAIAEIATTLEQAARELRYDSFTRAPRAERLLS